MVILNYFVQFKIFTVKNEKKKKKKKNLDAMWVTGINKDWKKLTY